jgi:hypothetical protein
MWGAVSVQRISQWRRNTCRYSRVSSALCDSSFQVKFYREDAEDAEITLRRIPTAPVPLMSNGSVVFADLFTEEF